MAQSLAKNYIHIVFSTKNREDTMRKEDLAEIFSYISGIIKNCECNSISVGGTTNHIHILCTLNKNLALTKLIATIKANSSKWLHQKRQLLQSLCLARWIWSLFRKPITDRKIKRIHCNSRRAP